jgi:CBS domain-containing protein
MQIGVKTVTRECPVDDAMRILVEHEITGLPVLDGADLAGIITEKDLLKTVVSTGRLAGTVEEYMTTRVVAFDEGNAVAEIWDCLVRSEFRRVPILRAGELTGVISRGDLIRASLASRRAGRRGLRADEDRVRAVMTPGLLTITPEGSLEDAAATMVAHEITGLPVVDDRMHLVGIVSEKDILKLVSDAEAYSCPVERVMIRDVVSFAVEDELLDLYACLAENPFRRTPVVDGGKLVGIVSRADLIVHMLKRPSSISTPARPASAVCRA